MANKIEYHFFSPDRLPLYERIFDQSVRGQAYRYSEVPHPPGAFDSQDTALSEDLRRGSTLMADEMRRPSVTTDINRITLTSASKDHQHVHSQLPLQQQQQSQQTQPQPLSVFTKDTLTSGERQTIENFHLIKKRGALTAIVRLSYDIVRLFCIHEILHVYCMHLFIR